MTPRKPTSIVINRPYGEPIHLRVKGSPHVMDDGSIGVTCKDEKNRRVWVGITRDMLNQMKEIADAN